MIMNKYNIFWWRDLRYSLNFGDEMVPWLFDKMFGMNLNSPCDIKQNNVLISLGSLLWASHEEATIWGSGILSINENIKKPKKICSVRGLFSRKRILEMGYECPEIFGDPAMLSLKYFSPKVEKKYDLGIIPHIVDFNEIYEKYKGINNIKIIDLRTSDIESVILDIVSCKKTISSALHPIIISTIYEVPTRWVVFSNKLYGDGIKFYDFFSSFDKKVFDEFNFNSFKTKNSIYNPIIIDNSICIEELETYKYDISNFNDNQILNSFPF